MSFTITGPGLYRTRDGRKAKVAQTAVTLSGGKYWLGTIEHYGSAGWYVNGRESNAEEGSVDLIAPWEEPVATAKPPLGVANYVAALCAQEKSTTSHIPYHLTEQFRAETARMLLAGTRNSDTATADMVAKSCVMWTDALIAALDEPQPHTP